MSPCLHEPHEFLCNFKHREREGEQDHPGKNRKRSPPTKISMKQCYERKNPLKICISIYIYIYIYLKWCIVQYQYMKKRTVLKNIMEYNRYLIKFYFSSCDFF